MYYTRKKTTGFLVLLGESKSVTKVLGLQLPYDVVTIQAIHDLQPQLGPNSSVIKQCIWKVQYHTIASLSDGNPSSSHNLRCADLEVERVQVRRTAVRQWDWGDLGRPGVVYA